MCQRRAAAGSTIKMFPASLVGAGTEPNASTTCNVFTLFGAAILKLSLSFYRRKWVRALTPLGRNGV